MNKVSIGLSTALLPIMALLFAAGASAEVYRWVDERGKVHYSDKKPDQRPAEEISSSVSNTNIDESARESRKLKKIFAGETPAETALQRQRQAEREAERQRVEQVCAKARTRLDKLRGRVYFIDENGQGYNITEAERKEHVEKMEAYIGKHCQ